MTPDPAGSEAQRNLCRAFEPASAPASRERLGYGKPKPFVVFSMLDKDDFLLCFYDNPLSVDDFQLGEMAVAGESSFAARLGGYGKSGEWGSNSFLLVCAGPAISESVQRIIQLRARRSVRLLNLDLGPYHRWPKADSPVGAEVVEG